MEKREAPSFEQKKYVATVCPEYSPRDEAFVNRAMEISDDSCDKCLHWNDGQCVIFDEVLTGIDQT
ncbi:MAG: hypothetical protein GX375_02390 [Clostridiales bacterium]|nr:hypothetical protein [Clostridiales bacterium]